MKAKEVILLLIIIAAGVFFYHAYTGNLDVDFYFGEGIFWDFEDFIYEESLELEPPFPSRLRIVNSHGKIEIQGTEEQTITIDFQKKIWRKNEEKAKEVADKLKMIVDKDENRIRISTNRNEFRRKNFDTNFKISIPKDMDIDLENSYGIVKASDVGEVKIYNRHGEVILSEISGKLDIHNSYEDVEIEDVESSCWIESKHSTVLVKNVKGGLKIDHSYGKILLEDISQDVEIESPHTEIFVNGLKGKVDIQNSYEKITLQNVGPTTINGHHSRVEVIGVKGGLKIINSYAKADLENIQGNLDIEGKHFAVSAKKIIGEKISISSSYEDIELSDFSAETIITLHNGNSVLDPGLISHPIQVKSEYGKIKFFWPKGIGCPFEARAKGGEVKWNLPVEFSFSEEDRTSIVKAFQQVTDKPSVFLSTSYGDIVVEEQTSDVRL